MKSKPHNLRDRVNVPNFVIKTNFVIESGQGRFKNKASKTLVLDLKDKKTLKKITTNIFLLN